MNTQFPSVYNRFLNKITDDMYMELTPEDTQRDLQSLLLDAIPGFEFPRKVLDYELSTVWIDKNQIQTDDFVLQESDTQALVDRSSFIVSLTSEEINILAILMMANWLQRQITSIENIRMKYSGSDFKMTSQANHLSKLLSLQAEVNRQSHHMQRLYKRRRTDSSGQIRSNWSVFRTSATNEDDDDNISKKELAEILKPFED